MTEVDLELLQELDAKASSAPWHVLYADDDVCMNSVLITRNPDKGRISSARDYQWEPEDVVAACLLQSPAVAVSADRRWDENAKLIAAVRNALPKLLRLARIGLDVERS
jgi:hypothetical protein